MAIKEWTKLNNGEIVPLERTLAAFDMFVLHERHGDFQDVCIKNLEPRIAANSHRLPLVLTILHSNSAGEMHKLWINRRDKKLSGSQNS